MMAASLKLTPINTKLVFSGDGAASPETIGKAFARMAREDIAKVDRDNAQAAGGALRRTDYVAGAEVAAIPDFVDPESTISARWEVASGAVAYAESLLEVAGPRRSGAYRKQHAIYADGVAVASVADVPPGAREVLIVSLVPYARKIERGRKKYAPGAVYQSVAALVAARYGNVARVKFTFAAPEGPAPALDAWAASRSSAVSNSRKRRAQIAKDLRNPAILIYLT
ncbi:hypothetical protein [Methylosinus sp. LW4]|uniref:hypothetical protein n=1 Tax=Methylosinus sp. LW4 TaxID=136993 RepID=UPI0012FB74EF|nr:hypothetical protein [Methylosinus sp. LW4]